MKKFVILAFLVLGAFNLFYFNSSYAKSIELNGIKVTLTTEIEKKKVGRGIDVKEPNRFSNTEYETEKSEPEDKYVKVELAVKNSNTYESANVIIEELLPMGFRQISSDKIDKVINVKVEKGEEKRFNYSYQYHKSFLRDQYSSIAYDEDGNIIYKNEDVSFENQKSVNKYIDDNIKTKQENQKGIPDINEESEGLRKGAFDILKFLIIFIACVILLIVFLMFYKTIRGNDNFFNYKDPFNCFVIFLLSSIIIRLVFCQDTFAKTKYSPQIYEYGKSYEKVIYEPVHFNDDIYRFAYKISFSFDSSYEISDIDYETDTDGDLLVDALEYQYMTDKENVDTDGDGISDYMEVMFLDYNPLSDDTFEEGIKDGDRDFDNDKLINIEEVGYGTDLTNVDTDYDTLTDYDEIKKYNTDPLNIDTDEDLLIDSDELKLGLDPNNPRTDGVTLDSEKKIKQDYAMTNVPEDLRKGDIFIKNVSGRVSGNIDNEVKISKENEEVFNSMSSFVQSGFKVDLKEDEKIDIELDVSKVSDRRTTLIIVKYDNGVIEAIDTICDGDSLKASIGSGTYSVMDSEIILKDFNIMISDYLS